MTQGRPTAVSESTSDVDLIPIHGSLSDALDSEMIIWASLFLWKVKLAHIQNKLSGLLNRPASVFTRLDGLVELDEALLEWRDTLPLECRPDQEILVSQSLHLNIAMLHLDYFNLMRAVHWASMTSIPAQNNAGGKHSNPRIRSSESICLAAIRSFIKTLNRYDGQVVKWNHMLTSRQYLR
jgi:hypothetical protein